MGPGLRGPWPGDARPAVNRAPDTACAFLASGARVAVDDEKLRALREAAAPLGLAVLVAGDPPEGVAAEVVVGHRIAAVMAGDGAPLRVTGLVAPPLTSEQAAFVGSLGVVATFLVASGPLASCSLVRGTLGERDHGGAGRFVVGGDMQQNPHRTGVWGELLLTADSTPRACELPPGEVYLVARYD